MKNSEKYCASFTASLDVIKMNNECHLTGIFSLLSVRNPGIFRSPLKNVFFWMELRINRDDSSQLDFNKNIFRNDFQKNNWTLDVALSFQKSFIF